MERGPVAEIFASFKPEERERLQALRAQIDQLPTLNPIDAQFGPHAESDVLKGTGIKGGSYEALIMLVQGQKLLRLTVHGEPRNRASMIVDFVFALKRTPDGRSNAHDDLGENEEQLYWKLPQPVSEAPEVL